MFRAMRIGSDLTAKAFMALEEVLQQCRYGAPERSYAVRFALAYLWALKKGDRAPYTDFWRQLGNGNDLVRFRYADRALRLIYGQNGVVRDEAFSGEMWRVAQASAGQRRGAK